MAYRVPIHIGTRGGARKNPMIRITAQGRSKKNARANARRFLRKHLKNINAGFYDDMGVFHPIRASADYSPARAGEKARKATKRKRSTAK